VGTNKAKGQAKKKARKTDYTTEDLFQIYNIIEKGEVMHKIVDDILLALEEAGYPMKTTKYYEIHAEYVKYAREFFMNMANGGLGHRFLRRINQLEAVEAKSWGIFNSAQDDGLKLAALKLIKDTQREIAMFDNSTPMVEEVQTALEEKVKALESKSK
jgi:nucleoside diphosphate kinase